MRRMIPQKSYGIMFIALLPLLVVDTFLILCDIFIPEVICGVAVCMAVVLAYFDHKNNATKSMALYGVYVVSAVLAICISHFYMSIIPKEDIYPPRWRGRGAASIIFIAAMAPGFLLIKMYQKQVNNKLKDLYSKKYKQMILQKYSKAKTR